MILFVGERRSSRAKKMKVTWVSGRLAAKTLFDALRENGVEPEECSFCNWFERGAQKRIRAHVGPVVAIGRKVQSAMARKRLPFTFMIHPAARGAIRLKENYCRHVAGVLEEVKKVVAG